MSNAALKEKTISQPIFQRDEDMVFRRLGEDLVLVPIRKGLADFNSFYILNDVAAFLWEALAKPSDQESLAQKLTQAFECSLETARKDCGEFLEEMRNLSALKQIEKGE